MASAPTPPELVERPPGRAARRGWVVVLVLGLLVPPVLASGGTPAAAAERPAAAANAAWLGSRLVDGRYDDPLAGHPDYGLMADAIFAMYAAGRPELAAPIVRVLDDEGFVQDYVSYSAWRGRPDPNRVGGSVAKSVVVALVARRDPRDFGGLDLVAELEGSIVADGPEAGRLRDHGPIVSINNANTFGQAHATLAFAGLAANRADVIDKLRWQQCSEGYFRAFYSYNGDGTPATCDEGKIRDRSSPDGDSTGLALSAMLAARRAGAAGLDDAIDRARAWLVADQHASGGWAGGVSTDAPNTNSTGLVVQALAEAGGADGAVERGRAYVLSAQVTGADADNDLRAHAGAIAYQPAEYEAARVGGITNLDTWIRASAQAALGLADVGFFALVTGQVPTGPPVTTTSPPPPTTTRPQPSTTVPGPTAPGGAGSDRPSSLGVGPSPRAGSAGVAPGTRSSGPVVVAGAFVAEEADDTPAGRLGRFLVAQLTDGDHVEVEVDGAPVVDYDATAEVALALRSLGEQPAAARRITQFLLDPRSVDAFVRGVPYESDEAVYVEPLAKLVVLAELQRRDDDAPPLDDEVTDELRAALDDRRDGGELDDVGEYADLGRSTSRHSWALLALRSIGAVADAEVAALLAAPCADGSFPASLAAGACTRGDLDATADAALALAAAPAADDGDGDAEDGGAPSDDRSLRRTAVGTVPSARATAVDDALAVLHEATVDDGLVVDGGSVDVGTTARVAASRAFLGDEVDDTTAALAALQRDDGGFAEDDDASSSDLATSVLVAGVLGGGPWATTEASPVVLDVDVEGDGTALGAGSSATADVVVPRPPAQDPAAGDDGTGWWIPAAVLLVAAVLGVAAWRVRRSRTSARPTLT